MREYTFTDALTGAVVTFDYENNKTYVIEDGGITTRTKTLFYPGCSFINYAIPLVDAVYKTLLADGLCDGISVLCCGKILSYEDDGVAKRAAFEHTFVQHVIDAGIESIICACPNCIQAMHQAFSTELETAHIEILVLPQVLADAGYRVDSDKASKILLGEEMRTARLCVHDSCPDRNYGDFADGIRDILPNNLWVDPSHCRRRSVCCGSLPRAAGKYEQANKCAKVNVQEALDVNADAIVTSCISCALQLSAVQRDIPTVHYLELLYNWRIDWDNACAWMKTRFLFEDSLGIEDKESTRKFVELKSGLQSGVNRSSDAALQTTL
jgi:Fe-S oxidoreductase